MSSARCEEKLRLMQEYQAAADIYLKAVADLVPYIPPGRYEALRLLAEHARKASVEARADLDRHIAEHGC